nr:hypothetical protein BN993_01831 [Virgibacillus halodenitrificans]
MKDERNKENFRLGRLHFHIQWGFMGFAHWEEGLDRRQRAMALAGGPVMSLLVALLLGVLSLLISQSEVRQFVGWIATLSFIQFILTMTPLTYPRWTGGYSGFPSDGLQLIRIAKEFKKAS